jgi:hypothetical protein
MEIRYKYISSFIEQNNDILIINSNISTDIYIKKLLQKKFTDNLINIIDTIIYSDKYKDIINNTTKYDFIFYSMDTSLNNIIAIIFVLNIIKINGSFLLELKSNMNIPNIQLIYIMKKYFKTISFVNNNNIINSNVYIYFKHCIGITSNNLDKLNNIVYTILNDKSKDNYNIDSIINIDDNLQFNTFKEKCTHINSINTTNNQNYLNILDNIYKYISSTNNENYKLYIMHLLYIRILINIILLI